MPPRDWLVRIEDILEACTRITGYIGNLNQDEFTEDSRTVDAVIRNLTVIGEAAIHIPAEVIQSVSRNTMGRNAWNQEYRGS